MHQFDNRTRGANATPLCVGSCIWGAECLMASPLQGSVRVPPRSWLSDRFSTWNAAPAAAEGTATCDAFAGCWRSPSAKRSGCTSATFLLQPVLKDLVQPFVSSQRSVMTAVQRWRVAKYTLLVTVCEHIFQVSVLFTSTVFLPTFTFTSYISTQKFMFYTSWIRKKTSWLFWGFKIQILFNVTHLLTKHKKKTITVVVIPKST